MVVWLGAGTDIMKFVAGAQCHRGGKTVLRYLRGPAGAGERRDAPLEDIIKHINLLFRETPPPPPPSPTHTHIPAFLHAVIIVLPPPPRRPPARKIYSMALCRAKPPFILGARIGQPSSLLCRTQLQMRAP
jgi:hypothetical protein